MPLWTIDCALFFHNINEYIKNYEIKDPTLISYDEKYEQNV